MSILNTSVSGMQANSNWLSSISQNVANANTTGYKNVETDFSTLVDQIANGAQDFGGVSTSQVSLNSLQGNVVSTSTADQPRRPGRRVFRRLRLQRHALSDAQRLLHARRLRQPRQQRRLLPDGGERPKRRFAACRKLADRSCRRSTSSTPVRPRRRPRAPRSPPICRPLRRRSPPPICRPPIRQARPIPKRPRWSSTTISAARTRSISISPTPGPTPGRSTPSTRRQRPRAAAFPIRPVRWQRRP